MGDSRVVYRDSNKIIEKSSLYILALRQIVREQEYFLELFLQSMLKEWYIFRRHQKMIIGVELERALSVVKKEDSKNLIREVLEYAKEDRYT